MEIKEAIAEFFNSIEYKEIAKLNVSPGSKYRTWLTRFKNGQLKTGVMVDILLANGYEIRANKVTKKRSTK